MHSAAPATFILESITGSTRLKRDTRRLDHPTIARLSWLQDIVF
jgi:hypothetical protein